MGVFSVRVSIIETSRNLRASTIVRASPREAVERAGELFIVNIISWRCGPVEVFPR